MRENNFECLREDLSEANFKNLGLLLYGKFQILYYYERIIK